MGTKDTGALLEQALRQSEEMPKNARERSRADTRRRLMDAWLELASAKSPASVSIRDIATKAQVSVGALYCHFKDKETLNGEVALECFARLVRELDNLRAPLSDAELKRRRASGLTPAQDALLTKWGYPYVMDEFRFHLTLSGKLQADELQSLKSILQSHISHLTRTPIRVDDVGLVGEAEDGRFHLIRRLPLAAAKR